MGRHAHAPGKRCHSDPRWAVGRPSPRLNVNRLWTRRAAFALLGLAALSIVICLVSVMYALNGPEQKRTLAWAYGVLNLGFATINGLLGFGLLALSRSAKR